MEYQSLKYIYQPAGAPANTLLLLHGTGGDENDLIPLAKEFGTGFNILSLRGNVSEGGMPRFFRRLGMGIFDEKDLAFRTHEMVAFIRGLAAREGFDATRIIALGYSNGANIVGSTLLLYPDFLAGAILYRPMQPFKDVAAFRTEDVRTGAGESTKDQEGPATNARQASANAGQASATTGRSVPVFLSNGTADPTIQAAAAKAYAALLKDASFDVSYHLLPAGHNLTQQDLQLSVEWFGKYFPAAQQTSAI
jgi:phospholipase/carboxylesterase